MQKHIQVSINHHVAHIQLGHHTTLNALSIDFCNAIDETVKACDDNTDVKVILLSSTAKHFCAGADIAEMQSMSPADAQQLNFVGCVKYVAHAKKPIVVAVHGLALGGGCELVEMCDIVIASSSAKFGHPEITLAAMPGAGGTQRLTRALGKAQSMDLLLTGRTLSAQEALAVGLVSRVVQNSEVISTATSIAEKIASFSTPVAQRIKASVKNTFEQPLSNALKIETSMFHQCFTESDFQEGLTAFVEKRAPKFTN